PRVFAIQVRRRSHRGDAAMTRGPSKHWGTTALATSLAIASAACEEPPVMPPPRPSATAPAPSVSTSATAAVAPKLPPRLASFLPPGGIDDFPAGKERERAEFFARWSRTIDQWTEQAILGDPWTVDHDHDRKLYYNPL